MYFGNNINKYFREVFHVFLCSSWFLRRLWSYQVNSCDDQTIGVIIEILERSWVLVWRSIISKFLVHIFLGYGSRLNKLVSWRSWGYDPHWCLVSLHCFSLVLEPSSKASLNYPLLFFLGFFYSNFRICLIWFLNKKNI